jgi:hypothetical protein
VNVLTRVHPVSYPAPEADDSARVVQVVQMMAASTEEGRRALPADPRDAIIPT